MSEVLIYVGIVAGWIVLQRWVLPALGIPTCMSGACSIPQGRPTKDNTLHRETSDSPDTQKV